MTRVVAKLRAAKFWFFLLRLAIRRYLRRDHPKATKGLDALIISPGGVATTFLIDYLSQSVRTHDRNDADWIKHLPYVPDVETHHRLIYVYGPPADIYASLKRRDFHRIQAAKLGCPLCMFVRGTLHAWLSKRAIAKQTKAFHSAPAEQVLCIEYNALWEAPDRIAAHLGIKDPAFVPSFPPRRARTSVPQPESVR
ncbi:MAG: hypothetical protein AAF307_01495 [Pseudomonadota bacterium]